MNRIGGACLARHRQIPAKEGARMRYVALLGFCFASMVVCAGCQQSQPAVQEETPAVRTIPPRRGRLVERDGKMIWMDETIQFDDE